jgi:dihydroneopterin triphosphate diphosphatase
MSDTAPRHKRPESVLVVVYSKTGKVLLLKRADHADFWQSVTGSMHWEEQDPRQTTLRELEEETGLHVAPEALLDLHLTQRFAILPKWRHRYAPEVDENVEHAFALELPQEIAPQLAPLEHTEYGWFAFEHAQQRVASWTNRNAIQEVQKRLRPT